MEKQIVIKIIGVVIIFTFAMFFLQAIIPSKASAATTGLNWENPNKSGNNPYKFKPKDALNSQLIMQVVGCTGVVDKISNALSGLFQKKLQEKIDDQALKSIIKACKGVKGGTLTTTAGTTFGTEYTTAMDYIINCSEIQQTNDAKAQKQLITQAQQDAASKRATECFNGIAVTLARNQLTAMTRYTMNWVNSGFNGNPMYVRDITSFTSALERNVLETGIDILTSDARAYPYGSAFSRSAINSYKSRSGGLGNGATNFLDSLTSNLSNFVTDPRSYYSETALEKANRVNNTFANDFSTGGWDAWLALTQIDQNNPLGFAMQTSQYLADQMTLQTQNIKDELYINNGFLSQKRCVKWQQFDSDGNPVVTDGIVFAFSKDKREAFPDKCVEYEVVTPGSLIKDKVSTYINSPERQLELADTINESLNALFAALIAKFQNQGLSSLSSSSDKYVYSDPNMGLGIGYNGSIFNDTDSSGGGYTSSSFDLTRDLGNIYIHNYSDKSLGDWNAKSNVPELHIGVGPFDEQGNPLVNVYYNVSVAGNTKLISDGYNGWAIGDRAFWNGSEWQNWKCGRLDAQDKCTFQTNPIDKRGVIQIQKDYIVAAKELLANLPNIMPKIGELDYCIPGPNTNWQANSGDAYSSFSDYAYSLSSEYKSGKFLKRDSTTFSIAQPGDKEFDNYKAIFDGTPTLWDAVTRSYSPFSDWAQLLDLGNKGTQKNDSAENSSLKQINDLLTNISSRLQEFNNQYSTVINNLYGNNSLMLKPYLENELTSNQLPNPAYLPMAETGLNITKDIVSYDEDIATMTQDYKDSIVQANSNIYKLNKIKDEVSKIIKAAQDRRNANMIRILNEEATRNGTAPLTEAQYNAKYAVCLDEENITFYDDTDIMSSTGGEEGRCNDNLDNDLDGLIDMKDLDCQGVVNTTVKEICANGIDDDLDGLTDILDPDCQGSGPTTEVYYTLLRCGDGQPYVTGPFTNGTYSTNERVMVVGDSYSFYTVQDLTLTTEPIFATNIFTSSTGELGCP